MTIFDSVEMQPEDPILGLGEAFREDHRPSKVNLGIGAYKNSEGSSQVLNSVRKAERILLDKNLDKDYPPIPGDPDFIKESLKLVYGENSPALASGSIAAAQTLGGTGALRIGGDFLVQNRISEKIYISDPSWPNHPPIFRRAGMKVDSYPYYDMMHHSLNFSGMRAAVERMPPGSVLLLQPCCHNPTGLDPSFEQWKELAGLVKHHKLIPFFDLAYQGFSEGLSEDAKVVRTFVDEGMQMLVANSYSKNFGLYGERVGMLSIVCADQDTSIRVNSQIKQIIRGTYSMPPLQGQRIVTTILQSEELREEWMHELKNMRLRINEMRKALISGLQSKAGDDSFQYLRNQTGMFSFSGFSEDQVQRLKQEFGIYMPRNGRVNIAGINIHNMDHVINSILSVM